MDGVEHTVKLIDTAGQEEYERVRKLFYNEADCFILCYDVSNRDSYNNIISKWLPELKGIDRWPIPIVLVGKWQKNNFKTILKYKEGALTKFIGFSATKTDLRRISRKPLVTTEDGETLSRQILANRFVECSAKENYHIQQAIHEALRASVKGPIKIEEKRLRRRPAICSSCCQSWRALRHLYKLSKLIDDYYDVTYEFRIIKWFPFAKNV